MSNENEMNIKFGADIAGLKEGSQAGANAFEHATSRMKGSVTSLNSVCSASMANLSQNVDLSLKKASEQINVFNQKIGSISKAFSMIGQAVMLGFIGEKIFDLAKKTGEYAHEMELASQKTGMATSALQGWGFAASLAGGSVESIITGMRKFSQEIVHAKEGQEQSIAAFGKLGISVTDLKNLKMEDLLMKVADAFKTHADGANKSAIAVELFGRSGLNLIPILNLGREGVEQLMKKAKEMGVIMSEDDIKAAAGFEQQLKLLHAGSDALQRQIGLALTPSLNALVGSLQDSIKPGGQLNDIMTLLPGALNFVAKTVSYVAEGFQLLGRRLGAFAAIVYEFLHGNLAGCKAIADEFNKDYASIKKGAEDFRASLDKPVKIPPIITEGSDTGKPALPTSTAKGKGSADKSRMSEWEEIYKEGYLKDEESHGEYIEKKLSDELAYWQKIADLPNKSNNDTAAVQRKITDLKIAMFKEEYDAKQQQTAEETQLAALGLKDQIRLNNEATKSKQETYQFQERMGQISTEQALQEAINAENERVRIEMELLEKLKIVWAQYPKEYKKVQDDIAKGVQQHNEIIIKYQQDAALQLKQKIDGIVSPIVHSFGDIAKGIAMHTMTIKDAFVSLSNTVLNVIMGMWEKMLTNWISNLLIEQAATTTAKTAEATTSVAANASIAASGAAASQASVPIIGPALAAAAAAAMFGLVMGYSLHSASGGYDIPAGVNPMTQLHSEEMVLPANIAGGLRGLISGGGSAPSGGGRAMTVNVQSFDSKDFGAYMKRNGRQLLRSLAYSQRAYGGR